MYSKAQLQSFFGSNYDASTLPIAFTSNSVMAIVPFIVIIVVFILIINYNKKGKKNLSSKELVVYKSSSQEDRNNQKQNNNIYYYFNVYVKQPNKNGKKNYNNKAAKYTYQKKDADDVIDAEIL